MNNMLSWGLKYLYKVTSQHTDVDILIGLPDTPKYPLKATIPESRALFDSARVKMIGQRFHFMIDRVAFEFTELPLVRGLQIEVVGYPHTLYELVLDPKGSFFYNDHERQRIVLITTEKEC